MKSARSTAGTGVSRASALPCGMTWLIGFVCGVTLCALLPSLPDWRVLALAGGVLALGSAALSGWGRVLGHGALMVLLGVGYAAWRADLRMARALAPEWEMQPLSLVVIVRGLPSVTSTGSRLLVDVERIETASAVVPARLRLASSQPGRWRAGSRWRVRVKLHAARATANPQGFDVEQWMWAHGLMASGRVISAEPLGDASDVLARIDRLRARIVARVERVLGGARAASLINALTVGDQQGINRLDWQIFARTGVTHLVSISGLHIGMVAGMAALALRALLKLWPPTRWPLRVALALAALAAAGVYALLAGWSVPTQRTFFMLWVAALLLCWRRALAPFQVWWLALSAVLLLDPFAVFLPGLWLSFGLVAALMYSTLGWRRRPGRVHAMLLGQWACSVMSLVPLIGFFASFPLVSPLANLLAIPWISIVVAPLALLAVVFPWDGGLWLVSWLAQGFFWVIEWLARAPLVPLPRIPWSLLALGLFGSFWLIAPPGMPGRALGALLLLPMLSYTPARPLPGVVWISVLDVGQGLSVLVRTQRHNLLYDTGALAADQVLLPQLTGLGVRHLDALVLSHHDSDHDGAAAEVVAALSVAELLVGQSASIVGRGAAARCAPGRRWSWDGIRFEVLAPLLASNLPGNNAQSCVLRIASQRQSMLLAGDIPAEVEAQLVERYGPHLASSVLLAPHHGSKTSSSLLFLRNVAPHWAVISSGYRNRYGHPHASVLANYHAVAAQVLRTDQLGALEIRLSDTVEVHGYRQTAARYWRSR